MAEGWKYRLRYGDRKLELAEGKLTVGRSRHCDLSIQEPSISRKHVFVTVGAGRILIQDLGSSNGTYVNGRPAVGESALHDGDELRLGHAALEVEIRSAEDGLEARPDSPSPIADHPPRGSTVDPAVVSAGQEGSSIAADQDDSAVPTQHLDSMAVDWKALEGERAGFWPRLAAVVVDGLWGSGLVWLGLRLAGQPGALAAPVVLLAVTWLGWAVWGTTPGKRLFGLYVYSVESEVPGRPGTGPVLAALRLAGCLLSVLLFGLGFLAVAFSPSRLALHDRLAGTYVVRKRL